MKMTIEDMIKAGASWSDITMAAKKLMDEEKARKEAERKAAQEREQKQNKIKAAKKRAATAFVDYMALMDPNIEKENKEDMIEAFEELIDIAFIGAFRI